ncbi:hypothetical protein FH610_028370 [Microbispora catharanthi]|uniref:HTH hxlR-type domain-containing protein n=1 Tax=Microbispora catharanthi TaxID=1712871 RepID=A0A5N6BLH8_9ACTN|nr:winged helix-turn-helix transcriptional regulator [Microbispora catharanthi]KAB8181342.1 hypothetical protein FH610_028370 [Microbispora catharanthi]
MGVRRGVRHQPGDRCRASRGQRQPVVARLDGIRAVDDGPPGEDGGEPVHQLRRHAGGNRREDELAVCRRVRERSVLRGAGAGRRRGGRGPVASADEHVCPARTQAPPRVDYALTEAGTALLAPMRAMGTWAVRYADAVLDAQDRFTARFTARGRERRRIGA